MGKIHYFDTKKFDRPSDGGDIGMEREDLSSLTDGAKTSFSLSDQAVPGTEKVFLNGSLQQADGDQDKGSISNDYALDPDDTINFSSAPAGADTLVIYYRS